MRNGKSKMTNKPFPAIMPSQMTDDAVRRGPELTLRSILVGLVVAAIIGSATRTAS